VRRESGHVGGVLIGIQEVDPQQLLQSGRQVERFQPQRNDPVVLLIVFPGLLDLPSDPVGFECRRRHRDDGEAAVLDPAVALLLQRTGLHFPGIEPDAQTMFFHQHPSQRLNSLLDIPVMAEKQVVLPHGLLGSGLTRQERLVQPALVEVWEEPIFQHDGAAPRAVFDPAGVRRNQRAAALGDGMANRRAADQFAVKAIQQHLRRFDMHRMAHRQHAANAGLDQSWSDRPKNRGLLPTVPLRQASSTTSGI
jgi:hypothetical protein